MMPRPGRPTPDAGIAAARAKGIELSRHRSAHLSREEAMAATVIVVFDDINRRAVQERYPDIRAPVLKLGEFLAVPVANINDPIDGDQAVYGATYAVIERAVDRLVAVLAAKGRL
jgi:protein-tyrosine-phosphatase